MSPTAEELELGAKVYQQVRLYEKSEKGLRRTPWIFAIWCVLILAILFELKPISHSDNLQILVIPAFFALVWQKRQAKVQYTTQKLLLLLLEDKYGDALPWVVEEKQLAQARELEAAVAQHPSPISHA